MKLRLLAASVAALALTSGAVLAQSATPAPAPAAPANSGPSQKALESYAVGYDIASDMANRKADLDIATLVRGIQDGYAKREPTMPTDKLGAALESFQKRMADQARAEFDKAARENKARSDAFLAANKAKPGVVTLPGGLQYKIIDTGTGPKPTSASTVSVHLRGSITTGQEFANTYNTATAQPVSFKVSEYPIVGVREALLLMPVGSRWEVYIPAEKALGNEPRSPIGPGQAVIFDIKLISSK